MLAKTDRYYPNRSMEHGHQEIIVKRFFLWLPFWIVLIKDRPDAHVDLIKDVDKRYGSIYLIVKTKVENNFVLTVTVS